MPQKRSMNIKKSSKGTSTAPETENDFLAVGVDFEEAGEKWRAGDAAKSARFFIRAIEIYSAGLEKFPHSFDLAYNSARLQYELTQQPRLFMFLPKPLPSLLQSALGAHRFALQISEDNADLLFNTAQVLASFVEFTNEGKKKPDYNHDEELYLLKEALELLQRCLEIQLIQSEQAEKETTVSMDDTDIAFENNSVFTDESEFSILKDEKWATVFNPITKDTLIDTVITQLDTLSTTCSLMSSQNFSELKWVEEYLSIVMRNEIAVNADSKEKNREVTLAKAKCICTFSDVRFRCGYLDISAYEQELDNAFLKVLDIERDPQGLCDQADSELLFNKSIQASLEFVLQPQPQDIVRFNSISWKHITKALDCFTAASKLSQAQNLSRIHLRRGDCELYRFRLGQAPNNYNHALKSAATLMKNAEIYYRGAAAFAKNEGASEEETEALVKEAAVASLGDNPKRLWLLSGVSENAIMETLEDMEDEGLLSPEAIAALVRHDG